jgi:hypothetical protein
MMMMYWLRVGSEVCCLMYLLSQALSREPRNTLHEMNPNKLREGGLQSSERFLAQFSILFVGPRPPD